MRLIVLACVVVGLLSGVAWAQMPPPADSPVPLDPAPPPPPEPTPTPATTTTTTNAPAPAPVAEDNAPLGSAFGVGVHAMLGNLSLGTSGSIAGPVGPAFVYNGGRFHIEAILAYQDVDGGANTLALAGRGWYHVHESPGATLSVGGGLGLVNTSIDTGLGTTNDFSLTVIEAGAQIRFFATRNVALSASLGLSILSGDNDADAFMISGQLTGGLGITYFIF
jgi:hypothetical protein